MTQKDYKALSAVFANWRTDGNSTDAALMHECLARGVARALAADNPQFDPARFYRACDLPRLAERVEAERAKAAEARA